MLLSSNGVVIHSFKYGENSIISKVISKEKGLLSLISNRRKGKRGVLSNYFQPFTPIHFVCYLSNKSNIHRLKEVAFNSSLNPIKEDVASNAIRFFLAELLNKLIKEEEENNSLYDFIETQINHLNSQEVSLKTFHISFLINLSSYLGIQPYLNRNDIYFDLKEGSSVASKPQHSEYCEKEDLLLIIKAKEGSMDLSRLERNKLLNLLLNYYNVQLGAGVDNFKSKAVLELVFS